MTRIGRPDVGDEQVIHLALVEAGPVLAASHLGKCLAGLIGSPR